MKNNENERKKVSEKQNQWGWHQRDNVQIEKGKRNDQQQPNSKMAINGQ